MRHGRVVELRANRGEQVRKGQGVMVIQIGERTLLIDAPFDGKLVAISSLASQPEPGELLFTLELSDEVQKIQKDSIPLSNTIDKPPNISYKKVAVAALTISIIGLLTWFYWSKSNLLSLECIPTERLDAAYNDSGEIVYSSRNSGNTAYEFQVSRADTTSLILRRREIEYDYRAEDVIARRKSHNPGNDFWQICGESNCESSMTINGPRFAYLLSDNQVASWEFNFSDLTVYAIQPYTATGSAHNATHGEWHTFYRCMLPANTTSEL